MINKSLFKDDFTRKTNLYGMMSSIMEHKIPRGYVAFLDTTTPVNLKITAVQVNGSAITPTSDFTQVLATEPANIDTVHPEKWCIAYDATHDQYFVPSAYDPSTRTLTFPGDSGLSTQIAGSKFFIYYLAGTGSYRVQIKKAGAVMQSNVRVLEGSLKSLNMRDQFTVKDAIFFPSQMLIEAGNYIEIAVNTNTMISLSSKWWTDVSTGAATDENHIATVSLPILLAKADEIGG